MYKGKILVTGGEGRFAKVLKEKKLEIDDEHNTLILIAKCNLIIGDKLAARASL